MENNLTIRDMPPELRPREHLLHSGARSLSNAELLAILLRTGTASSSALDLGTRLLCRFGNLKNIMQASLEELQETPGIGLAKAAQLQAAFEISRRLELLPSTIKKITCAADVARFMQADMQNLDREYFKAILVDIRKCIIGIETISIGILNASLVHPRELFKAAIRRSASAVIIVHNHPSGDTEPSNEDLLITRRIVEAGKLLGIDVLDHLIIGENCYLSLKERGLF